MVLDFQKFKLTFKILWIKQYDVINLLCIKTWRIHYSCQVKLNFLQNIVTFQTFQTQNYSNSAFCRVQS